MAAPSETTPATAGRSDFRKPVNDEHLGRRVRSALQSRRPREENSWSSTPAGRVN